MAQNTWYDMIEASEHLERYRSTQSDATAHDQKQSCNVFLPVGQYGEIKELGHKLSIPYSELIREGVSLVLKKYKRKESNKGGIQND